MCPMLPRPHKTHARAAVAGRQHIMHVRRSSTPDRLCGMIFEHVVLPVIPGRETQFLAAFAQAQPIISSNPGFVDLTLNRGIEHPNEFLLLVRWETVEAHTIGFRHSAGYLEWRKLLHHFYDPFPKVVHFEI